MKVIENTRDRLVVRSTPWIMGSVLALIIVVLSGVSLSAFLADDTEKAISSFITGPIFAGVAFALFVRRDELVLDSDTGTMEIRHATVFRRSVERLDLKHFERASTQTRYSSGGSDPMRRVALLMTGPHTKDIHNISPVYRGGPDAENAATAINDWLKADSTAKAKTTPDLTTFDIVMKTPGATKIEVVKVVRRITGLGLTEAKRLIAAGGTIKGHMAKSEAEDMKAQLEAVGAEIELVSNGSF